MFSYAMDIVFPELLQNVIMTMFNYTREQVCIISPGRVRKLKSITAYLLMHAGLMFYVQDNLQSSKTEL